MKGDNEVVSMHQLPVTDFRISGGVVQLTRKVGKSDRSGISIATNSTRFDLLTTPEEAVKFGLLLIEFFATDKITVRTEIREDPLREKGKT